MEGWKVPVKGSYPLFVFVVTDDERLDLIGALDNAIDTNYGNVLLQRVEQMKEKLLAVD